MGSRHQSTVARIPCRRHLPLPLSPLGLSNYDALDREDDLGAEDSDGSDEGGGERGIYSDFSILEPAESVVDDHDLLDRFEPGSPPSCTSPFSLDDMIPSPLDELVLEMSQEKERQKTISFVQLYDMAA